MKRRLNKTVRIAICNNKGGAGKTTSTQHIGSALAELGFAVTVADVDPQANLTDSLLGTRKGERPYQNIGRILTYEGEMADAIYWSNEAALWVIPSDENLDDVADDLVVKPLGVMRLKTVLDQEVERFGDFLLIDCPPNLGVLTYSALVAVDYVVIPAVPEPWSLNGIQRVLDKLDGVRRELGRAPAVLGTIATMMRLDTVKHQTHLEEMCASQAKLLGVVPKRDGRDAEEALFAVYLDITKKVLGELGVSV